MPRRAWSRFWALVLMAGVGVSCGQAGEEAPPEPGGEETGDVAAPSSTAAESPRPLVELLEDGQVVFGIFSGDHTAEQGAAMAANAELDFVFYSLEQGPFDIPAMQAYVQGMRDAAAAGNGRVHPLLLRIPPVRDDREAVGERVRQALEAGVDGVVFPHVETAEEAALAVGLMGDELWPQNPGGRLVNMLLIEDRVAIGNAAAIVGTPGVSIVAPGPGDLRRAYEGDAEAIEGAIQTVLAACKELGVPCAITAGPGDIAERIEQGFRVFIVTDPEAITVGRRAAGRE